MVKDESSKLYNVNDIVIYEMYQLLFKEGYHNLDGCFQDITLIFVGHALGINTDNGIIDFVSGEKLQKFSDETNQGDRFIKEQPFKNFGSYFQNNDQDLSFSREKILNDWKEISADLLNENKIRAQFVYYDIVPYNPGYYTDIYYANDNDNGEYHDAYKEYRKQRRQAF